MFENNNKTEEEPKGMAWERRCKLLAYVKVCFENNTNPFASVHLIKKNVNADECRELSQIIADLIDADLITEGVLEAQELVEQAEIEFEETQQ